MSIQRIAGTSGSMRSVPALVVTVLGLAALSGTSSAAAAGHPDGAAAAGAGHATAAGLISTVAGGVGGPGKAHSVALGSLCGATFGAGRLYLADAWSVREMNPQTTWLSTPAGTGTGPGTLGDGGPASRADVYTCGVGVDHSGNLVIGDQANDRVRVVAARTGTFYGQHMTARDIYTVAGDGTSGFSGDGGPATSAELAGPGGMAVDAAGNLVFADTGNGRIRVVAVKTGTFYGQHMTARDIYTVAGGGTHRLGTGGLATKARVSPDDVAVDAAGNLVIADTGNSRIRVVAVRTGTFYGQAMTAGHIYNVAGAGRGRRNDGGPATSAALLFPQAVTVDGTGNLVIADTDHSRIRVVAVKTGTFYGQAMTAGDIYTVAGSGTYGCKGRGGPATSGKFHHPTGVAVDGSGNLVITSFFCDRAWVAAAHTGTFYGKAMTAGDLYTIAGDGSIDSGDGGPATKAEISIARTFISNTTGVALDHSGNLAIADEGIGRVRLVAARTGTFYGRSMKAGHIYYVAGGGSGGDGSPGTSAELNEPAGVAMDAAGNLLIAAVGDQRIRVVAASTGTFYGQHMTAGDIYTIAGTGSLGYSGDGGPATSAQLNMLDGVAVDAAGNLLIADLGNERIRVVAASTGTFYGQAMTAGDIYTIAGNGTGGSGGDGGPATSAKLGDPAEVAADAAGNVVIADTDNQRIRVVAASTGTFYGQHMTAGDIYTIAGNGKAGFSGDGGPGTSAKLRYPVGVAVDSAGNPVIADTGKPADPGGGGQHRHVLRPAHDRRGHLHHRRQRQGRVLWRRRPSHERRTPFPNGGGSECRREHSDRRHGEQPDPDGDGLIVPGVGGLRCVHLEARDGPVKAAREPPVGPAEQLHDRWHQDHPDQGGVDQDGDGQAEAEHVEDVQRIADDK